MCDYDSYQEIFAQVMRNAVVDKLGLPHSAQWDVTHLDEPSDCDYWLVSYPKYEEWKKGKLSHEKDILFVVGSSDAETTHSAKTVYWLRDKWLRDEKSESLVFYLNRVYFSDVPSTVALQAIFQQLIYQDPQALQHAYNQQDLETQWMIEATAEAISGKVVYIMTDDLDASKVLKIPSWLQPQSSAPSSRPLASFKFLIHLEKRRVLDSGDVLTGCNTIDLDTDTPQPRIRETYIERKSKEICWAFSQPKEVFLELVDIIKLVEEESPKKAQRYVDELMSQSTFAEFKQEFGRIKRQSRYQTSGNYSSRPREVSKHLRIGDYGLREI